MRPFVEASPPRLDATVQLWHGLAGLAIALESIRGMLARLPSSGTVAVARFGPAGDDDWLRAYA